MAEDLIRLHSINREETVQPLQNKKEPGSNLALRVSGLVCFFLGISASIAVFALVVKVNHKWGYALPFTFAAGALGIILLQAENDAIRSAKSKEMQSAKKTQ